MEISKFLFFWIFYHFLLIFTKLEKQWRSKGGGGGVLWQEIKGLISGAFGLCAGDKTPYPGA
jgi:hypothetical protein